MDGRIWLTALACDRDGKQLEATIAFDDTSRTFAMTLQSDDGITRLDGDPEFWAFSSEHVDASFLICKIIFKYFNKQHIDLPVDLTMTNKCSI